MIGVLYGLVPWILGGKEATVTGIGGANLGGAIAGMLVGATLGAKNKVTGYYVHSYLAPISGALAGGSGSGIGTLTLQSGIGRFEMGMVALGAGLGALIGSLVARYARSRVGNGKHRTLLAYQPGAIGGAAGGAIGAIGVALTPIGAAALPAGIGMGATSGALAGVVVGVFLSAAYGFKV
jgi:hypothetical protein